MVQPLVGIIVTFGNDMTMYNILSKVFRQKEDHLLLQYQFYEKKSQHGLALQTGAVTPKSDDGLLYKPGFVSPDDQLMAGVRH